VNDTTTRDILTRLALQEAELATLRRANRRRPGRATRRGRLVAALAVALLVALVPLSILAANPFTDLTGGVHDANIDAIYNAGITTGCVPNAEYCPTANVTREEMASFLARTAGLGSNKPVANAARLATTNPTATSRTFAANELVRASRNSNDSAEANVSVLGAQAPIATPVATVKVNAPGRGFILLSASGTFRFAGCANCTVRATLAGSPFRDFQASEATTVPMAFNWLVAVDDAGEVNVPLILSVTRPGQAIPIPSGTFANPQITAIYVPFGSTGNSAPGDIAIP
jgi:hypothetical protein